MSNKWFWLLVIYVIVDSFHEYQQNKNIYDIVMIQQEQLNRELERLLGKSNEI